MEIDRQEAETLLRHYLDTRIGSRIEVVVLSDRTIEKDYGWIFRFQSKDYLEGKTKHILIGNGPVLVEKSGKIIPFPTAISLDESIKRYEQGLPLLSNPKVNRSNPRG